MWLTELQTEPFADVSLPNLDGTCSPNLKSLRISGDDNVPFAKKEYNEIYSLILNGIKWI